MANELHLVCRVGTTWVGIPAVQVEAVVKMGDVVPAPHAPPAVRGLVAIRSRLLTLIDCAVVAGAAPDPSQTLDNALMVVVSVDGHGFGLLVDEVDDVIALSGLQAVAATLAPAWQALAGQMADNRGRVILTVEPSRLIVAAEGALPVAA